MIGVIVAIILLVGSLCLMIAAIIDNQINPTYANALGISYAGMFSVSIALLGLVISVVAYGNNKEMKLAKRTMVFGIVSVVTLVLLFSLVPVRVGH